MIIRRSHYDQYTVVANELINDSNLGFEALGLLVYLLSKPADWKVVADNLANEKTRSVGTIYKILKEIRAAGYITLERQADGTTVWTVFDHNTAGAVIGDNPPAAIPTQPPPPPSTDVLAAHEPPPPPAAPPPPTPTPPLAGTGNNISNEKLETAGSGQLTQSINHLVEKLFIAKQRQAAHAMLEKLTKTGGYEAIAALHAASLKNQIHNKLAYLNTIINSKSTANPHHNAPSPSPNSYPANARKSAPSHIADIGDGWATLKAYAAATKKADPPPPPKKAPDSKTILDPA